VTLCANWRDIGRGKIERTVTIRYSLYKG